MSEYCCEGFANQIDELGHKSGCFEQNNKGEWNIAGCCGGGCYVIEDMKFCPFCGVKISSEMKT